MSADAIVPVFTEALRTSTSHQVGMKKLHHMLLSSSNKVEFINIILLGYYDKVLVCTKKDASVDRIVSFFSTFSANIAADTDDSVFAAVLQHLIERTKADNKVVRGRACETLSHIFAKLSDEVEFSVALWKAVEEGLLPLLRDKCANVRLWAVRAIKKFQTDEDPTIVKEVLRLMASDPVKDIRAAATTAIALKTITIGEVVQRMEDISADVRKAAVLRLTDPQLTIRHIPMDFRPRIVKNGLLDRNESVVAATAALVMKWFEQLNHNILRLFKCFDMLDHEKELNLVANCVLLELDTSKIYTSALKDSVFNQGIDQLKKTKKLKEVCVTSAEVFWVICRCEYAKSNWGINAQKDLFADIVPSMEALTKQMVCVSNSYKNDANGSGLSLFRWLLRLTAFVNSDELDNNKQLIDICMELLNDVTLPDQLVDDVWNCWASTMYACNKHRTEEVSEKDEAYMIQNESELIEKVIIQCNALQNQDPSSSKAIEEADAETLEETEKWMESYRGAISIRILQSVSWALRRGSGGRIVEGNEHFISMTPWIIDAITHPSVDLRCLGVRCLGLLTISEERYYVDYFELINQILGNNSESTEVRAIALKSLFDAMLVHNANQLEDNATQKTRVNTMVTSLTRVFASNDEELVPIACEGVAKLLFCGIATNSSKLCSCLLKKFFIEDQTPTVNVEDMSEDELYVMETNKNNRDRIQQVLSLFFHSFYMVDASNAKIIQLAIPEVIEDYVMELRNDFESETKPNNRITIQQLCEKLLGFCEYIKKSSNASAVDTGSSSKDSKIAIMEQIVKDVHMTLFASVTKQLLKSPLTGQTESIKQEKLMMKDMIKGLNSICHSSAWIVSEWAIDVLKAVDAMLFITTPLMDKATLKYLNNIRNMAALKHTEKAPDVASPEIQKTDDVSIEDINVSNQSAFFNSAFGLADIIHLTLGIDNDAEYVSNADIIPTSTTGRPRRATAKKTAKKIEESESEGEDESGDSETDSN